VLYTSSSCSLYDKYTQCERFSHPYTTELLIPRAIYQPPEEEDPVDEEEEDDCTGLDVLLETYGDDVDEDTLDDDEMKGDDVEEDTLDDDETYGDEVDEDTLEDDEMYGDDVDDDTNGAEDDDDDEI
jgi:hypothetical protein